MNFKDKSILCFFGSLYTVLGIDLWFVIHNITMKMWHFSQYILVTNSFNNSKEFADDFLTSFIVAIGLLIFALYATIQVFVYFLIKKTDLLSALIFTLITFALFVKIELLIVYNSFYNHGLEFSSLDEMLKMTEESGEDWNKFQINMKCCGVYDIDDYQNHTIPKSCCGWNEQEEQNCTKTDSYQIGCYSKYVAFFQEYNQFIIWSGIEYDLLTMFALFLLRYSKMFVVVKTKPCIEVIEVAVFGVD